MADGNSLLDRTRFGVVTRRSMMLLVILGVGGGLYAAYFFRYTSPETATLFATAAVTLLYGSLLGGVVTQLFADLDRGRVQRAAEVEFITNVLADLKSVYDQVDRGRTLILAHRSAKTYGDEMRGFIKARVKLQNVERALHTDARGTPIRAARDEVERMGDYLRALLEEFEARYKEVSIKQSVFEAQLKRALDPPQPSEPSVVALPRNAPWDELKTFPRLTEFLLPVARGSSRDKAQSSAAEPTSSTNESKPRTYKQDFLEPLDTASAKLRKALMEELS